jgi:arylsulfatase A-like enzyme
VVAGPKYRAMYSKYDEGQQHFFGCITALDEQVGRLRQELRNLGIANDTMLWFASDNGPEGLTGDQGTNRGTTGGMRGRKRSLFSGGVNVPGLLEWPGHAKPGRVIETSCSTLDYLPTIKEATHAELPGKPRPIDGISLLPLLRGETASRPVPLCFRYIDPKKAMHGSPTVAMLEGRFKLLTNFSEKGDEDMLYDVIADRGEADNIITKHRDMAQSMKKRLRDWIESCKASHAGADYEGPFTPLEPFPIMTGTWTPERGGQTVE